MAEIRVGAGSGFAAGATVKVYDRTGDHWPGQANLGGVVKSLKVGQDSTGSTSGVDGGRYWVSDGDRFVGVTAKDFPEPKQRTKAPTSADPQKTPSAFAGVEIHVGPKGTKVGNRVVETKPAPGEVEPQPHVNQATISDKTPQRSATPLGQATPADPDEPQPKPAQADVKKGTLQRSDTEAGEATPISEHAGPQRQEDAKASLRQRSSTDSGEQTPLGSAEPRGSSDNPDSREQAAGERPTGKAKPSKPKASRASSPAKPRAKKKG